MNATCHKMAALPLTAAILADVYNLYLDRRERDRHALTDVLAECLQRRLVSAKHVCDALKDVFDQGKDLLCDLPLCYLFIAQYLSEFDKFKINKKKNSF